MLQEVIPCDRVATGFVYVSTVDTFDVGWETMVFECDENGNVISWTELDVSNYDDGDDARSGHLVMTSRWRATIN